MDVSAHRHRRPHHLHVRLLYQHFLSLMLAYYLLAQAINVSLGYYLRLHQRLYELVDVVLLSHFIRFIIINISISFQRKISMNWSTWFFISFYKIYYYKSISFQRKKSRMFFSSVWDFLNYTITRSNGSFCPDRYRASASFALCS